VEAMTEQLRHRGPDGGGLLDRSPFAVLGHRRLAIIDVAQGQQPMPNGDGSLWITFNGEIYNYRELKKWLATQGHSFRTESDTEVILAAYSEWGDRCLEHLEGMFAFGILDLPQRRMFLGRDRLGEKPLYLRWRNGILDFASELSALRRSSDWQGELDPLALSFYLRLGYIPSPWTVFRGVEKLRPAEYCVVDHRGMRRELYWKVEAADCAEDGQAADILDELDATLEEAVRMRLMSEVPLGAFLSGGIDSGLVVSLMAKISGAGVKTTCVGFSDEDGGGELEAARLIAGNIQAHHDEVHVEADATSILPRLVEHFGEPFADSSAIPTWYLSQAVRQRVTVALTGDGGDESFGGYDFRYHPHRRDASLRMVLPRFLRQPLFRLLASVWPDSHSVPHPLGLRNLWRNLSVEEDAAFFFDLCITQPSVASALAPELTRFGVDVEEHVRAIYRAGDRKDPLKSIMLADLKFYLPEDVLVKVDRMSMAHGLEVRPPLLARKVVEFAYALPSTLKLQPRKSKVILRRLAARYLPPPILSLPKRGFHVPINQWFRSKLRTVFESEVLTGMTAELPWLQKNQVLKLWKEHQHQGIDHGSTLWSVWVLTAWKQSMKAQASIPHAGTHLERVK
jgi:asparagine synthase (glutamine-hydrolysing)